jgi:hypothetical protein
LCCLFPCSSGRRPWSGPRVLSSPRDRHTPHARRRRLRLEGPLGGRRFGDRGLDPPALGRRAPPRLSPECLRWLGARNRLGRRHARRRAPLARFGGPAGGRSRRRPARCRCSRRTRFGQISDRLRPRHGSHRQPSFPFARGVDPGAHDGLGRLGAWRRYSRTPSPRSSDRCYFFALRVFS